MRVWSFGGCEFDEEERRLWVRNRSPKLGDKVLEVLQALLTAPGHCRSSIELSRLWGPNGSVDSVKDAVRQLRRAMCQGGASEEILRTVRGTGFAIGVPVRERTFEVNELWRSLRRGASAPGLPGWQLEVPLEPGARSRVWQIKNEDTHVVRVVKYATDPARRAALRREVRAWEAFERALPQQKAFVRVYGAHLTTRPCFVESEYGGQNLLAWTEDQRARGGLSRAVTVELMASLAEAVAAAHSLGILHNDLKPANVLLSPAPEAGGGWQVKVADFGVATVMRENRLAEFQLGERTLAAGLNGVGGTSLYRAPEVGPGTAPTFEADVYALGVILFQLLCGDFQKTPTPGWEAQIDDEILQADIAAACNVDPVRRPKAGVLAEQLRGLDARRAEAARAAERRLEQAERVRTAERLQQAAERQLNAELARRPWRRALAACVALLFVLLGSGAGSVIHTLRRDRDRAEADKRSAVKLQRFLEGFFFDGDAAAKGPITAEGLAERGLEKARLLEGEPAIHAQLLNTLGSAFQNLGDAAKAEQLLERALTERVRTFGPESPEVAETLLQQASLKDHESDAATGMQLAQRALRLQQRALPAGDIEITRTQEVIGQLLTSQGQYRQAILLLEGVIRREEGHPDLLADLSTALNDLGIAENYDGNLQRSIALQEASMRLDRQMEGERHPDVAEHLLSIANAHDLLGDYRDAAAETSEALSILRDWLPPAHHEIAAAEAHLGTELAHTPATRPEARQHFETALTMLGREPKRSQTEAYAESGMGALAHAEGHPDEALAAYGRSLAIYRQLFPDNNQAFAAPLTGMANIYYEQGRWPEFDRTVARAFQVAQTTMDENSPRRLTIDVLRARSLLHAGHRDEAKALLDDVVAHSTNEKPAAQGSREAAQVELIKLNGR